MKVIDVFGGMTAIIRGLNARMGRVEEDYPHGDLLQQIALGILSEMAKKAGILGPIYGPDPHYANGLILEPDDPRFSQKITLPHGLMTLIRGREAYADGVVIPIGGGLFLIAADCAVIIIVDISTGKVVGGHAALLSLLNLPGITSADELPFTHSVVDSMMEKFQDSNPKNLRVLICFSIHHSNLRYPFDHVKFGEQNQRLVRYLLTHLPLSVVGDPRLGQISLQRLVGCQLLGYGLKPDQIFFDDTDTYSDHRPNGTSAYNSARRERVELESSEKRPWSPLRIPLEYGARNFNLFANRGTFKKNWKWTPNCGSMPWSMIDPF